MALKFGRMIEPLINEHQRANQLKKFLKENSTFSVAALLSDISGKHLGNSFTFDQFFIYLKTLGVVGHDTPSLIELYSSLGEKPSED